MKTRIYVLIVFLVCIFSILFGYVLVFGNEKFIRIAYQTKINIYPDSLKLKSARIIFESNMDISKGYITSKCNLYSKYIRKYNNFYMFEISFLDDECKEKHFSFEMPKGKMGFELKLNIITDYRLLSYFVDYNSSTLNKIANVLENKISKFSKYKNVYGEGSVNSFHFLQESRMYKELIYIKNMVQSILKSRQEKYIVPVLGKSLPRKQNKIPNSQRIYRKGYTDGIHHGWDIDTKFGKQVVALDDAIVLRVVLGFVFDDLGSIQRSSYLDYETQLKNLDILRGNQIWLKTMKGDVVFYSHLNDILPNVKKGEIVKKGQAIGRVGITGIPDKNYNDYHLHFAIHKNPFNPLKAGKYDYMDYMGWDWLFKGKPPAYILKHQYDIFEK